MGKKPILQFSFLIISGLSLSLVEWQALPYIIKSRGLANNLVNLQFTWGQDNLAHFTMNLVLFRGILYNDSYGATVWFSLRPHYHRRNTSCTAIVCMCVCVCVCLFVFVCLLMSKDLLNVSKQLIEHLSHALFLWAWMCVCVFVWVCVCVGMWWLGEVASWAPGVLCFSLLPQRRLWHLFTANLIHTHAHTHWIA